MDQSWACGACTLENPADASVCGVCGTPNANAAALPPAPAAAAPLHGMWACDTCTLHNPAGRPMCGACGSMRPASTAAAGAAWQCRGCGAECPLQSPVCGACGTPMSQEDLQMALAPPPAAAEEENLPRALLALADEDPTGDALEARLQQLTEDLSMGGGGGRPDADLAPVLVHVLAARPQARATLPLRALAWLAEAGLARQVARANALAHVVPLLGAEEEARRLLRALAPHARAEAQAAGALAALLARPLPLDETLLALLPCEREADEARVLAAVTPLLRTGDSRAAGLALRATCELRAPALAAAVVRELAALQARVSPAVEGSARALRLIVETLHRRGKESRAWAVAVLDFPLLELAGRLDGGAGPGPGPEATAVQQLLQTVTKWRFLGVDCDLDGSAAPIARSRELAPGQRVYVLDGSAAPAADEALVTTGARVFAPWPRMRRWFPGVVAEQTDDGRVRVAFDDGDQATLHPSELRLEPAPGDRVSVRYRGGQRSFGGVLRSFAREAGTGEVQYDDGDVELDAHISCFAPLAPPAPSARDLSHGLLDAAQRMRAATVAAVAPDGRSCALESGEAVPAERVSTNRGLPPPASLSRLLPAFVAAGTNPRMVRKLLSDGALVTEAALLAAARAGRVDVARVLAAAPEAAVTPAVAAACADRPGLLAALQPPPPPPAVDRGFLPALLAVAHVPTLRVALEVAPAECVGALPTAALEVVAAGLSSSSSSSSSSSAVVQLLLAKGGAAAEAALGRFGLASRAGLSAAVREAAAAVADCGDARPLLRLLDRPHGVTAHEFAAAGFVPLLLRLSPAPRHPRLRELLDAALARDVEQLPVLSFAGPGPGSSPASVQERLTTAVPIRLRRAAGSSVTDVDRDVLVAPVARVAALQRLVARLATVLHPRLRQFYLRRVGRVVGGGGAGGGGALVLGFDEATGRYLLSSLREEELGGRPLEDPSSSSELRLPPGGGAGVGARVWVDSRTAEGYVVGTAVRTAAASNEVEVELADGSRVVVDADGVLVPGSPGSPGSPGKRRRDGFACPYCDEADGLDEADLVMHVAGEHRGDPTPVVCPMCAAQPGGDPRRVSADFHGHLRARHRARPWHRLVAQRRRRVLPTVEGRLEGLRGSDSVVAAEAEAGAEAEQPEEDEDQGGPLPPLRVRFSLAPDGRGARELPAEACVLRALQLLSAEPRALDEGLTLYYDVSVADVEDGEVVAADPPSPRGLPPALRDALRLRARLASDDNDEGNSALAGRARRQLRDGVAVATGALPAWLEAAEVLRALPLATRSELVDRAAFGPTRASGAPVQRVRATVRREALLADADALLARHARSACSLEVVFAGERGYGAGVTQAFYSAAAEALRGAEGLWRGSSVLFPAPAPGKATTGQPWALVGRLAGKALMDGWLLPLPLAPAFVDLVLGRAPSDAAVAEALGPAARVLTAPAAEVGAWGLAFVDPASGEELRPGGAHEPVTAARAAEFAALVRDRWLGAGVREQARAVREGLAEVADVRRLRALSARELAARLCGDSLCAWDLPLLERHVRAGAGYTPAAPAFRALLAALAAMGGEQRREFLRFATGCPHLPAGGLAALQPPLEVVRRQDDLLPFARTCSNTLHLPNYCSLEVLQERLEFAVVGSRGVIDRD